MSCGGFGLAKTTCDMPLAPPIDLPLVVLLMAMLETEAALTTSHLTVLVLINVTRARNDSEVNENLKQLLSVHACVRVCALLRTCSLVQHAQCECGT